jgi:nucleotide-binding universal stress UspA family protein
MTRDSQTQVLDRPSAATVEQRPAGTGIKSILFDVYDDDGVLDRLQTALSIARAFGAHVHCFHVTPIQAYIVPDGLSATFENSEMVGVLEKEAAKTRSRIEAQLSCEDVTWDYEEITGEPMAHLIQSASLADLVVTGRQPSRRGFEGSATSLIGDLVEGIRSPLLVTGSQPKAFDPFGPALIAWNGSYEAANAVRAALPLLKTASRVSVVQFSEDAGARFPSTTLLEYLSRHGVSAKLEERSRGGEIADSLVGYAERHGAGLIVMGAYSHSRAGEFLFGGVTRRLLKSCPLPLLLAH